MRELAVSRPTGRKSAHDDEERMSVMGSQALAALEFVALLPVSGWWDAYIYYVVAWRFIMCRSVGYLLL